MSSSISSLRMDALPIASLPIAKAPMANAPSANAPIARAGIEMLRFGDELFESATSLAFRSVMALTLWSADLYFTTSFVYVLEYVG